MTDKENIEVSKHEPTAAHWQAHVNQLAEELGTVVVQKPHKAGMMYVEYEPPMIEGPIIVTQRDYMVMLHELGHVFHGHTQGRPPFQNKTFYFDNGVLKSEAQAWEYALDTTKDIEILPVTRAYMWRTCLNSYLTGAKFADGRPSHLGNGNRHYVEFVYDKPDKFFWGVKARILGNA